MATTVAATMAGLVYLTQTLGASATTAEIGTLEGQSREVVTSIRILQLQTMESADEEAIAPRARKQKLERLGEVVVLSAP